MTPTPRLRFVERIAPAPEHGENIGKTVRILQQWWEDNSWSHVSKFIGGEFQPKGEWRDIPLETET
jgi:hypothetical protein